LFGIVPAAAANPSPLPVISRLDNQDALFRQYQQDVQTARQILFSSRRGGDDTALQTILSSLTIFVYVPREGENIFSIAARTNIPLATLASLNRFSNQEDLLPGQPVLLPSVPGIFVRENPGNSLERLIFAARTQSGSSQGAMMSIPASAFPGGVVNGATVPERFLFIPGDDFTSTERVFFLNRGFQFPLREFRVTSLYGPRISPITGMNSIHNGIDLAAPMGAEVLAARSGTVLSQGYDNTLGHYIILGHDNNWASVYGHLSEIKTVLHQDVQSGTLIGRVGSTGMSTGPHLHFELQRQGQTTDPARMLRIFGGNSEL